MKVTITDNTVEKLELDIDEERSSLVQTTKGAFPDVPNQRVSILNPDEACQVAAHIFNFYKPEILVKHPDQSLPPLYKIPERVAAPYKKGFEASYVITCQEMLRQGWVRVMQIERYIGKPLESAS